MDYNNNLARTIILDIASKNDGIPAYLIIARYKITARTLLAIYESKKQYLKFEEGKISARKEKLSELLSIYLPSYKMKYIQEGKRKIPYNYVYTRIELGSFYTPKIFGKDQENPAF